MKSQNDIAWEAFFEKYQVLRSEERRVGKECYS